MGLCAFPAGAAAAANNGGTSPDDPQFKPARKAKLLPSGLAIPPADAPPELVQVIEAANRIATKPYRYGGGHAKVEDTAYDCSGSVSYPLIKAGLLASPMASGGFMSWAEPGAGKWITTYAKAGHMYAVIAGLRFDTSSKTPVGARRARSGKVVRVTSRWSKQLRPTSGYAVRHPAGL